jgi:hypothetical protein
MRMRFLSAENLIPGFGVYSIKIDHHVQDILFGLETSK